MKAIGPSAALRNHDLHPHANATPHLCAGWLARARYLRGMLGTARRRQPPRHVPAACQGRTCGRRCTNNHLCSLQPGTQRINHETRHRFVAGGINAQAVTGEGSLHSITRASLSTRAGVTSCCVRTAGASIRQRRTRRCSGADSIREWWHGSAIGRRSRAGSD